MPTYFLDSSALVKGYVQETGTEWVRQLLEAKTCNIYIARITCVEVIAALARRLYRTGDAAESIRLFRSAVDEGDFEILEITSELLEKAMELAEIWRLRGYDAVQLTAGLEVNRFQTDTDEAEVVFVSADDELNNAAQAEGILIENPNLHVTAIMNGEISDSSK